MKSSKKATDAEVIAQNSDQALVEKYRNIIVAATNFAEKKFHQRVAPLVDLYKLKHYEGKSAQDRVKVPYPFVNSRQLLADVYVKNPEPVVKPKKAPYEDPSGAIDELTGQPMMIDTFKSAEKLKQAITYVAEKINVKRESKRATLDFIVTGLGGTILCAQQDSKLPKIERISYKNMFIDPSVTDAYDSDIFVRKLLLSRDTIEGDDKYVNADQVVYSAKMDPEYTGNLVEHNQFKLAVIWDVWDRKEDLHLMIPQDSLSPDTYILKEEIPYQFEDDQRSNQKDWPVSLMINNVNIDDPWPIGDIAAIEAQVRELDKIRSYELNHIKRFNRKYQITKGTLDEQGKRQLKNAEDGTVVEKKNSNPIETIADAPISGDVYQMEERIKQDIQLFGGSGPDFLTKGVGQRPGTLGEAELIQESSNTINDMRRDALADYFRRLYRMIGQFIMQYWTEEDVILITGDGSKETDWLHYNPQEIAGAYDYDIDPTTFTDNSAVQRKQIMEAMSFASPVLSLPEEARPRGLVLLTRKLFELYGWKDVDEILPLPPEAPPLDELGGMPGEEDLESVVRGSDPEGFAAAVESLPPEQRAVIEEELGRLSSGTPTNAGISAGARRV